jgi:hypothetical protein
VLAQYSKNLTNPVVHAGQAKEIEAAPAPLPGVGKLYKGRHAAIEDLVMHVRHTLGKCHFSSVSKASREGLLTNCQVRFSKLTTE